METNSPPDEFVTNPLDARKTRNLRYLRSVHANENPFARFPKPTSSLASHRRNRLGAIGVLPI